MNPPDDLRRRQQDAKDVILLLLMDWAEERDTWETVSAELETLLVDGHGDAYGLGRAHGGDNKPDPDGDRAAGEAAWSDGAGAKSQAEYWDGLLADVEAGRYGVPGSKDDPAKPRALAARVNLYAHNWTATANDAWGATLPPDTLYAWHLGTGVKTEHCSQCERYSREGPYTWEDLPAVPGDQSTPCGSGCQCFLETEDGMEGFSR